MFRIFMTILGLAAFFYICGLWWDAFIILVLMLCSAVSIIGSKENQSE